MPHVFHVSPFLHRLFLSTCLFVVRLLLPVRFLGVRLSWKGRTKNPIDCMTNVYCLKNHQFYFHHITSHRYCSWSDLFAFFFCLFAIINVLTLVSIFICQIEIHCLNNEFICECIDKYSSSRILVSLYPGKMRKSQSIHKNGI